MLATTVGEHEFPFAAWTRQTRQSALRDILALVSRPGLLSFALGMPAAELFPVSAYTGAARHVLATEPDALQYGMPLAGLRRHVVELMARRGVRCTEDEVFITSGAQQAMSLLGQLLVSPGDPLVTEELTYDGMVNALRPLQPRVLTVPCSPRTGMDVGALEELLESGERPALIYTIPEGHNPLGSSMPVAARRRLAAAARRHGVPVVEDDAYGLLNLEGEAPPAVRSFDPSWVLYVGSFSKIVAPALRTGWVVAPPEVVKRLSILKQGSDLDVCTFAQRTLAAFLEREAFSAHLSELRAEYRGRRDAMLAALQAHFPADARWHAPASGMFVWVTMPEGVDTTALLRRAVEEASVAFVPGQAFCAAGGVRGRNALRLNFSRVNAAEIADGIARLGQVLQTSHAPVRKIRLPLMAGER